MDRKYDNGNELPHEEGYDLMERNCTSLDSNELDRKIDSIKTKLQNCHVNCEEIEMEICNVNALKNKGTFVLENVNMRYESLDEELKEIHDNYVKCINKASTNDVTMDRAINSLTLQRDNLRKELEEYERMMDENKKKLTEIKKMITIQEKKNMALARKLKRIAGKEHDLTPDILYRLNAILNDSRISKEKASNKKKTFT